MADEVGLGAEQERAVRKVVVGNFVSSGFDTRNQLGMAEGALANQEESGLGVVLLENLEDLGREDRVRAVIEREGNEGMPGAHAIDEIGGESLQDAQEGERLCEEHEECDREKGEGGYE